MILKAYLRLGQIYQTNSEFELAVTNLEHFAKFAS